jgi:hypothetical protein
MQFFHILGDTLQITVRAIYTTADPLKLRKTGFLNMSNILILVDIFIRFKNGRALLKLLR